MGMKHVVSVSLGSSKRDHVVETRFLGVPFRIERIGTDGDIEMAEKLIGQLDGNVDAIGLGGVDLYLQAGRKRYVIKDAIKLAKAARKTPVVDGSGLKDTLERKVIKYLYQNHNPELNGKPVLVVCGVDRFGMAESFVDAGAEVAFGDLMFSLGIPIPLNSLQTLEKVARVVAPVVCRLPFKYIYPTGKNQECGKPRFESAFEKAGIIAGDFHFIKKYMPAVLRNKIIITNTVTKDDVEAMRNRGLKLLVTTTPELNGRSFGTNVMEGVLVALNGQGTKSMSADNYSELLDKLCFAPRVEYLN